MDEPVADGVGDGGLVSLGAISVGDRANVRLSATLNLSFATFSSIDRVGALSQIHVADSSSAGPFSGTGYAGSPMLGPEQYALLRSTIAPSAPGDGNFTIGDGTTSPPYPLTVTIQDSVFSKAEVTLANLTSLRFDRNEVFDSGEEGLVLTLPIATVASFTGNRIAGNAPASGGCEILINGTGAFDLSSPPGCGALANSVYCYTGPNKYGVCTQANLTMSNWFWDKATPTLNVDYSLGSGGAFSGTSCGEASYGCP